MERRRCHVPSTSWSLERAFGLLAGASVFISDDFGSRCGLTTVTDETRVALVVTTAAMLGELLHAWTGTDSCFS